MKKITIPPQVTFLVPEGKFKAKVIQCIELDEEPTDEGPVAMVKVNFQVFVPGATNIEYRAGKKMLRSLEPGSDLRKLLTILRGRDFTPEEIAKGQFDPQELMGLEADIKIQQIPNKNHRTPYCAIMGFYPPGSVTNGEPKQDDSTGPKRLAPKSASF